LNHQNNYVGSKIITFKLVARMLKLFVVLLINVEMFYIVIDDPTKLLSDLYLAKFLDFNKTILSCTNFTRKSSLSSSCRGMQKLMMITMLRLINGWQSLNSARWVRQSELIIYWKESSESSRCERCENEVRIRASYGECIFILFANRLWRPSIIK